MLQKFGKIWWGVPRNCGEPLRFEPWSTLDRIAVAFDDPKTELIHFYGRQHSPQYTVTLPNGTIIKPSTVVCRLGDFFDRTLGFKAYVDKKIASASRALQMASRLKTSEWCLSSQHFRQLYTTCVLPILDFSTKAWFGGQKAYIDKLQILQNTVSRGILGAFWTSPIMPMDLEASLPPTVAPSKINYLYRWLTKV